MLKSLVSEMQVATGLGLHVSVLPRLQNNSLFLLNSFLGEAFLPSFANAADQSFVLVLNQYCSCQHESHLL